MVLELVDPTDSLLQRSHNDFVRLEGKWREEVFQNTNPICVELACGRGEYTIALAAKNPMINYIGVDIKGARIHEGAERAAKLGLHNVAFLRARIEQLHRYFAPGELDEIWITFPDPFPNKENRRMTSPRFLDQYVALLRTNGFLHFKTDDEMLFEYSVEEMLAHKGFSMLYAHRDIYSSPLIHENLAITTYYEKQHLQNKKTIKYLLLIKNDRNLQH